MLSRERRNTDQVLQKTASGCKEESKKCTVLANLANPMRNPSRTSGAKSLLKSECLHNGAQLFERKIALASLDAAHVAAVDVWTISEIFL
jgi:hypothetical protein